MNNKEKTDIINKCIEHYTQAYKKIQKPPYSIGLIELGKARALKEIIEEYIDCQPKKYYEKYLIIVKLENKFI